MRWLAILALAMGLVPHALAQGRLSVAQFRDLVISRMEEARPGLCVRRVDEMTIRVGLNAASCENAANVEGRYALYLANPSELEENVQVYVRVILRSLSDSLPGPEDAKRVVVLLRPEDYVASMGDIMVSRPFAGDLRAVLMLNYDDSLKAITPAHLESLGLSESEAFEAAARNLPKLLGELETLKDGRISVVSSSAGLAAGAPWLPDFCKAGSSEMLFLLFSREEYATANAADPLAAAEFRQVARQLIAQGQTLSRTMLKCSGGKWSVVR